MLPNFTISVIKKWQGEEKKETKGINYFVRMARVKAVNWHKWKALRKRGLEGKEVQKAVFNRLNKKELIQGATMEQRK